VKAARRSSPGRSPSTGRGSKGESNRAVGVKLEAFPGLSRDQREELGSDLGLAEHSEQGGRDHLPGGPDPSKGHA